MEQRHGTGEYEDEEVEGGLESGSEDSGGGSEDDGQALERLMELEVVVPPYWKNTDLDEDFDTREQVPKSVQNVIQQMLEGTWKNIQTRDRKGPIPTRLSVATVLRMEDSQMWMRYQNRKSELSELTRDTRNLPACTPVNELDGQGHVLTAAAEYQRPRFSTVLDERMNEFYLWHGTTPEAADAIAEDGFRIDLAGSHAGLHAGTMFGHGAYFAECSSKADEYAEEGSGIYAGLFCMLLCRVTCGQMLRVTQSAVPYIEGALAARTCDSVLGDREASGGTYREFIVFSAEQVYPEFVVLYRRETEEEEEEDDDDESEDEA